MSDYGDYKLAQVRSERDNALDRLAREQGISDNLAAEIQDLLKQVEIERLRSLNTAGLIVEANASIRIQRAIAIEDCAKALEKYGLARIRDEKDYPATVIAACLHLIRNMGGEK